MNACAPSLLELQRLFAAGLAAGGGDGAAPGACAHVIAAGMDPAERLAIYRNTSVSALTAALRLNYPAVRALVGDDFFEAAARAFVGQSPAASARLDDYGAGFGAFLSRFDPAASLPYLSGVAELEWAVSRALHAPDAAPLDLARLGRVPPHAQGRLRLNAHPALALVRADAPVDAIWHAALDGSDAALAAIDLRDGPVHLLVERRGASVGIERLQEGAWRFTAALCAAAPLAQALRDNPGCAAEQVLARHLAAGRFIDFELSEEETE
jgi:hypothetical protein